MFVRGKQQSLRLSKFRHARESFCLLIYSSFVILLIGIFIPFSNELEPANAVTDLTGDTSITFTSANSSASVSITPSSSGVFATTSGNGDIRFSVSTNNYTGYGLTIRGTKTTLDRASSGSLSTLSSGITSDQFSSGSNTQYNNRWGYKPNYYNSSSNTKYYGISTTSTTLDTTSAANSTAKSYTISLGARVDTSIPSGTYLNENVIVECTANYIPYSVLTVNYGLHVNSVSIGGTVIPDGETVNLIRGATYAISMTPEEDFTNINWNFSSGTVGSVTSANTTYTIGTSNATLNASASFPGQTIQNISSASCTTTANKVIDSRDDNVYTIKRLLDGNCWMMENLDLGRKTLYSNLTNSNTNIATTIPSSTFNGWKKTTSSKTYTDGNFIPLTTDNTSNELDMDSVSGTKYGTLYNYYAASAGTISGSSNSDYAWYDICPAGWRLPSEGTTDPIASGYGEYTKLKSYYTPYINIRAPIANDGAAFVLSGGFSTAPSSQGTSGLFWTSTISNSTNMARIQYKDSNETASIGGHDRKNGAAIRCIMKKPTHTLTISYDTGIQSVQVNSTTISNGGTIQLEENTPYFIKATVNNNFIFDSWSTTSGTLTTTTTSSTVFLISTTNATLTVSSAINGTYMQNLDPSACTSTPSTVFDSRDLQSYTIQRLNDGNCWMMENLNLGALSLTGDLTSANTNLANTISKATFNSWKKTSGSYTYDDGEFIPVSGTDSTTGTGYGTLYNFYATSAGTISGVSNSSNAIYDICPAGWRLPTSGPYGEFQTLYLNYNSFAQMRAPTSQNGAAFALAGYFGSGGPEYQGNSGYYWSSTVFNSNSTDMYYFSMISSGVQTFNITTRYNGRSIRCILKEPKTISKLAYMQNFYNLTADEKSSILASMQDRTTYNLIDGRDNKTYAVAKMKDGKIWMTENLDLGRTALTGNLTKTNTNLNNYVTASTFNGWKKTTGSQTYTSGEFINITGTDSTSGTNYGTLYNFYAASASTISGETISSNASYDICPAGWRLPTGGSSGETQALYSQYNSLSLMRTPITNGGAAFAFSGAVFPGESSSPNYQGSRGYYFTSTHYGNGYMTSLEMFDTGVHTDYICNRRSFYAIRCVAK